MPNPFLQSYGWTASPQSAIEGTLNIGQSERGTCAITWFEDGEVYGIGNLDLASQNGTSTLSGENLAIVKLGSGGQVTPVGRATSVTISYEAGSPAKISGTISAPPSLELFHILSNPNGAFTAQANTTPPFDWEEEKRAALSFLA